jgi:hypothetical protein
MRNPATAAAAVDSWRKDRREETPGLEAITTPRQIEWHAREQANRMLDSRPWQGFKSSPDKPAPDIPEKCHAGMLPAARTRKLDASTPAVGPEVERGPRFLRWIEEFQKIPDRSPIPLESLDRSPGASGTGPGQGPRIEHSRRALLPLRSASGRSPRRREFLILSQERPSKDADPGVPILKGVARSAGIRFPLSACN